MNVRRAPCVVVISPRISARPNSNKSEVAILIGECVAAAFEIRIERRIMLIHIVPVAARGISLPDLDQRACNRPSIFIHHPPTNDDALTKRLAVVLASEIAGLPIDRKKIETRPPPS